MVTFWISYKPIELGDLRPAEANGRIKVSRSDAAAFDVGTDPLSIEVFVKITSRQFSVRDVTLTNDIPMGVDVVAWDERCQVDTVIRCQLGDMPLVSRRASSSRLRQMPSLIRRVLMPRRQSQ